MKNLFKHLRGRFLIAVALACSISVSTLGPVLEVGASAISPASQTEIDIQAAPSAKNKTYNDTDPAWTYTGNWSKDKTRHTIGGQLHVSTKIEDNATISIEGARVTLIYSTSRQYGELDVFVDDVKIDTINQNKSKSSHQKEWDSPELTSGVHVIEFVHASGKAVNIDAVKVRGPKPNPNLPDPGIPTSTATPTPLPPQLPNLTESPVPSEMPTLAISPSPTNFIPLDHPTSTLPPEPTSTSIPSETAPAVTSTPSPLPTATASSIPTQVPSLIPSLTSTANPAPSPLPSPTASLAATVTSTSLVNPTATSTQPPTFTSTVVPTATSTPTSTVTSTATVAPAPGTSLRTYYVSAAGNNTDGKSWSTAWTGLSRVNWSIIQPGDTIYLSGGTTGATYAGGIQISKSGTASAYITIDTGANSPFPSGHNGTVIIEGGSQCFLLKGSYIKLQNIVCQHATDDGIRIEGTGMILENNTIRETYGQGIHVHYCQSCVVRGNRISTFPNDGPGENRPYQTDGIVIYDSSDTLVEQNWIRLTNQYGAGHLDGIQAYSNSTSYHNITVRHNYVENTKAQLSNSQGVYLENLYGDVKVIGNIVIVLQGNQAVVSGYGSNFRSYIIGNTIKCGGYRCLWVKNNPDPVVKNNLLWQTGDNYTIQLENWAGSASNIDNNLSYAPNSSAPFGFGSGGLSWSAWQTKGFDSHGISGQNPNLDNCFRPTTASPSVGKGAILADEYEQSLSSSSCGPNGPGAFFPVLLQHRIQYGGSSWDIGAYEFSVVK